MPAKYEYLVYDRMAHPDRRLCLFYTDDPPVIGAEIESEPDESEKLLRSVIKSFWRTDTVDTSPLRYTVIVERV